MNSNIVVEMLKAIYKCNDVEISNNGLFVKVFMNDRVAQLTWDNIKQRDYDLNRWIKKEGKSK